MVANIKLTALRNSEHMTFMNEITAVIKKYLPAGSAKFDEIVAELLALRDEEAKAFAVEQGSALTARIAEAEHYRDALHGSLYTFVKSFLYDYREENLFRAAGRVMRIIRQVGNPTHLAAAAATAKLIQLEEELKPYAGDLELLGAGERLEKLSAANSQFTRLSAERREDNATRPSGNVKEVRRQIDPAYKELIGMFNRHIKKNPAGYESVDAEINEIVAGYNRLIGNRAARKEEETEES